MSIDITPLPGGGSAVDMWASTYNEYFLVLANFAGSVNSKKKAIARLLDAEHRRPEAARRQPECMPDPGEVRRAEWSAQRPGPPPAPPA